jgi:hypothetical protein
MKNIIKYEDKLYAIHHSIDEDLNLNISQWYGEKFESLQASRMYYDKKSFKIHKHILNPRTIKRTQEAFIVIKGKITINLYESVISTNPLYTITNAPRTYTTVLLGSLTANAGDIIIVYDGFHELIIEEDKTICYEIKAGCFSTVAEDKEFLD